MTPRAKKYPRAINFEFTLEQADKLEQMANDEGTDMAKLVRAMVEARYAHRYENRQRCADSVQCRCPQFWAQPQQAPIVPSPAA